MGLLVLTARGINIGRSRCGRFMHTGDVSRARRSKVYSKEDRCPSVGSHLLWYRDVKSAEGQGEDCLEDSRR